MEAGASTEAVTSEETSTSVDTANDSEAFADAFATSEESTKAHTGGKIGKIHTITLENGKKQKVVEFYYEGGIKEFVAYLTKVRSLYTKTFCILRVRRIMCTWKYPSSTMILITRAYSAL